jgi:Helix-turn-helix.
VVLAEKNISNKALAEMVGVSPATISKWVTNTSQPHLDMLIKLSRCLNVMVNDLIRFPNDENIKSE